MRIPIAIIVSIWLVIEGWIAYCNHGISDSWVHFISEAVPITISAIVLISWIVARHLILKFTKDSAPERMLGVLVMIMIIGVGGWTPLKVQESLALSKTMARSFAGDAGWPSLMCSIFIWLLGVCFGIVCMYEILTNSSKNQNDEYR